MWASKQTVLLHQAKLAGTSNRFGAPLDLELAKDGLIMPFHRAHGEEQALADLTIREALRHEPEDVELALAQAFAQELCSAIRWSI